MQKLIQNISNEVCMMHSDILDKDKQRSKKESICFPLLHFHGSWQLSVSRYSIIYLYLHSISSCSFFHLSRLHSSNSSIKTCNLLTPTSSPCLMSLHFLQIPTFPRSNGWYLGPKFTSPFSNWDSAAYTNLMIQKDIYIYIYLQLVHSSSLSLL